MNATDLMIGDYIQVKDNEGNSAAEFICDIEYIIQWKAYGVRTCNCGGKWRNESEIEPIPLTRDIIERVGFPFNDNETHSAIQDIYAHRMEFFDFPLGSGFYIEHDTVDNTFWITDHAFIRFKYVHEFQHVLKLCGINKKIIL